MLGKLIGGIAGLAFGGPLGAVLGAAFGHAADRGGAPLAALPGRRDQTFAVNVVILAAKLARVDGAVRRAEIDAFKQAFRIPPDSVRAVGRLFDQARADANAFEPYAAQLGRLFADARSTLEDALSALFHIARADGPINRAELEFLTRVHAGFGLDRLAWDRARGAASGKAAQADPYAVLGLTGAADDELLRQTRKQLMRDNHPDSLAGRGAPAEAVAQASDKVARINAAWDQIKRERGL